MICQTGWPAIAVLSDGMWRWLALGILAAIVHAGLLWRSCRPPFHFAAWHLPRLLIVGAALAFAAVHGGLLAATMGWSLTYFALVFMIATRHPS